MAVRIPTTQAVRPLLAAVLLLIGSLALFWPGFAPYDSLSQFQQVLDGDYFDWHPPIMARWWAVLHALFGGGAAPMLLLQLAGYWLGLGLLGAALRRNDRPRAAALVVVLGCWPPFLGWTAEVLKDAQMTGALLAAVGMIGWWRLRDRRAPAWVWAVAAVLIGYATLVRANAVFATVPMLAMLVPGRPWARAVGALVGIAAVLALSGPINHELLGASDSGVVRTEAIYDLAGIAVRTGDAAATGYAPAAIATLRARRCVKPFFWDPLGEPDHCDALSDPLRQLAPGALYARLAGAALRHPLAYAAHRLGHLNSTERWLVPARWPSAAPPEGGEPNDVGLRDPGPGAKRFQRIAAATVEVPFSWPCLWLAAAVAGLLVALRAPAGPSRDLARALFVSALTQEASFAAISIASDLRYHLWSMLATALGLVLFGWPSRSRFRATGLWLVLAVVGIATVARIALPPAPTSYLGMLAS